MQPHHCSNEDSLGVMVLNIHGLWQHHLHQ
jgi:hypothetical protein